MIKLTRRKKVLALFTAFLLLFSGCSGLSEIKSVSDCSPNPTNSSNICRSFSPTGLPEAC